MQSTCNISIAQESYSADPSTILSNSIGHIIQDLSLTYLSILFTNSISSYQSIFSNNDLLDTLCSRPVTAFHLFLLELIINQQNKPKLSTCLNYCKSFRLLDRLLNLCSMVPPTDMKRILCCFCTLMDTFKYGNVTDISHSGTTVSLLYLYECNGLILNALKSYLGREKAYESSLTLLLHILSVCFEKTLQYSEVDPNNKLFPNTENMINHQYFYLNCNYNPSAKKTLDWFQTFKKQSKYLNSNHRIVTDQNHNFSIPKEALLHASQALQISFDSNSMEVSMNDLISWKWCLFISTMMTNNNNLKRELIEYFKYTSMLDNILCSDVTEVLIDFLSKLNFSSSESINADDDNYSNVNLNINSLNNNINNNHHHHNKGNRLRFSTRNLIRMSSSIRRILRQSGSRDTMEKDEVLLRVKSIKSIKDESNKDLNIISSVAYCVRSISVLLSAGALARAGGGIGGAVVGSLGLRQPFSALVDDIQRSSPPMLFNELCRAMVGSTVWCVTDQKLRKIVRIQFDTFIHNAQYLTMVFDGIDDRLYSFCWFIMSLLYLEVSHEENQWIDLLIHSNIITHLNHLRLQILIYCEMLISQQRSPNDVNEEEVEVDDDAHVYDVESYPPNSINEEHDSKIRRLDSEYVEEYFSKLKHTSNKECVSEIFFDQRYSKDVLSLDPQLIETYCTITATLCLLITVRPVTLNYFGGGGNEEGLNQKRCEDDVSSFVSVSVEKEAGVAASGSPVATKLSENCIRILEIVKDQLLLGRALGSEDVLYGGFLFWLDSFLACTRCAPTRSTEKVMKEVDGFKYDDVNKTLGSTLSNGLYDIFVLCLSKAAEGLLPHLRQSLVSYPPTPTRPNNKDYSSKYVTGDSTIELSELIVQLRMPMVDIEAVDLSLSLTIEVFRVFYKDIFMPLKDLAYNSSIYSNKSSEPSVYLNNNCNDNCSQFASWYQDEITSSNIIYDSIAFKWLLSEPDELLTKDTISCKGTVYDSLGSAADRTLSSGHYVNASLQERVDKYNKIPNCLKDTLRSVLSYPTVSHLIINCIQPLRSIILWNWIINLNDRSHTERSSSSRGWTEALALIREIHSMALHAIEYEFINNHLITELKRHLSEVTTLLLSVADIPLLLETMIDSTTQKVNAEDTNTWNKDYDGNRLYLDLIELRAAHGNSILNNLIEYQKNNIAVTWEQAHRNSKKEKHSRSRNDSNVAIDGVSDHTVYYCSTTVSLYSLEIAGELYHSIMHLIKSIDGSSSSTSSDHSYNANLTESSYEFIDTNKHKSQQYYYYIVEYLNNIISICSILLDYGNDWFLLDLMLSVKAIETVVKILLTLINITVYMTTSSWFTIDDFPSISDKSTTVIQMLIDLLHRLGSRRLYSEDFVLIQNLIVIAPDNIPTVGSVKVWILECLIEILKENKIDWNNDMTFDENNLNENKGYVWKDPMRSGSSISSYSSIHLEICATNLKNLHYYDIVDRTVPSHSYSSVYVPGIDMKSRNFHRARTEGYLWEAWLGFSASVWFLTGRKKRLKKGMVSTKDITNQTSSSQSDSKSMDDVEYELCSIVTSPANEIASQRLSLCLRRGRLSVDLTLSVVDIMSPPTVPSATVDSSDELNRTRTSTVDNSDTTFSVDEDSTTESQRMEIVDQTITLLLTDLPDVTANIWHHACFGIVQNKG